MTAPRRVEAGVSSRRAWLPSETHTVPGSAPAPLADTSSIARRVSASTSAESTGASSSAGTLEWCRSSISAGNCAAASESASRFRARSKLRRARTQERGCAA